MQNHLIIGCLDAIENWPPISWNVAISNEAKLFIKEYKDKMKLVLEHYKNYWTISNRP